MVERVPEYLYRRADPGNTETPRECHLQAMLCAFRGEAIPFDVYQAVLGSAERRQDVLKETMDSLNTLVDLGQGKATSQLNLIALAGAIVLAEGIDGPKAAKRRLNNLDRYFKSLLLSEELGPTE